MKAAIVTDYEKRWVKLGEICCASLKIFPSRNFNPGSEALAQFRFPQGEPVQVLRPLRADFCRADSSGERATFGAVGRSSVSRISGGIVSAGLE